MRLTDGGGRWLALLVLVGAVVAVAGASVVDDQPAGDDVLNDTRERYANAESVVGTADVVVRNDTASTNATVDFVVAGNQSRVAVTAENRTYRWGTNESVAWAVGPNRSGIWNLDALRTLPEDAPDRQLPATVPNRTLDRYENVSVELLREEPEDGAPAYVLGVAPENATPDHGHATLWIAKDDSRLLRMETTDGTNETVVDVRDTSFNVSVHESTFDPPSDRVATTSAERYDDFASLQSATALDVPRMDATFQEAGVVHRSGETTVAQRYRAGGDNATVVTTTASREFGQDDATARTVTVNGHEAIVLTRRDAAVVAWESGRTTTAVVVDGDEARALELARQLDA